MSFPTHVFQWKIGLLTKRLTYVSLRVYSSTCLIKNALSNPHFLSRSFTKDSPCPQIFSDILVYIGCLVRLNNILLFASRFEIIFIRLHFVSDSLSSRHPRSFVPNILTWITYIRLGEEGKQEKGHKVGIWLPEPLFNTSSRVEEKKVSPSEYPSFPLCTSYDWSLCLEGRIKYFPRRMQQNGYWKLSRQEKRWRDRYRS